MASGLDCGLRRETGVAWCWCAGTQVDGALPDLTIEATE